MLLRELFYRENTQPADDSMEKYGRPFNHPEHLVFFKGSKGTIEALNHFKEIATEQEGATTVRGKWDGNPQIYWGREVANGPLILAGHNQWSRGVKGDSKKAVYDFIANQSGKATTPQEVKQRRQFAINFSNLYPIFDAATPKDFVGFVYADSLFGVDPSLDKELIEMEGYPRGVWTFAPNPNSNTRYYVDADPTKSELGGRIARAKVMVVGHAKFDRYGAGVKDQQPIDDFVMFINEDDEINVGRVEYVMTNPGLLGLPGSEYSMEYAEDDKPVIVRMYEEEDGAWEEKPYVVYHRMSEVVKIESLSVSVDMVMEMGSSNSEIPATPQQSDLENMYQVQIGKAEKPNYEDFIKPRRGGSEPSNPKLYARVVQAAKDKFDVYPSAVANSWVVQEYKRRGGTYKSESKSTTKSIWGGAFDPLTLEK